MRVILPILFSLCADVVAEPVVKAVGVGVVWEDGKEAFGNFPTLNQIQPVKLALVVDMKGQGIIELHTEGSKLGFLRDDAGKDLKGELGAFPTLSQDTKSLRFHIEGEEVPSEVAKSLQAKGVLAVRTGSKTVKNKSKVVQVQKGEVVQVSDELAFEIHKAGKPEWGNEPLMVELKIGRDIPEVAEIVFYDEKGEVIEAKKGGSSRMGFLNKVNVQRTYNLTRKVDRLQIEVTSWVDMKTTKVPFEIQVGIGGS